MHAHTYMHINTCSLFTSHTPNIYDIPMTISEFTVNKIYVFIYLMDDMMDESGRLEHYRGAEL